MPRHALIFAVAATLLSGLVGCSSPQTPPPRTVLTESEQQDLIEDARAQAESELLARYPSAAIPAVALVRVVEDSEWLDVYAQCLTDAGFPATVQGDSLNVRIAAGQEEPQAVAYYVCQAKYPVRPEAPLSDPEISYLYHYYVNSLTPCLEAEGFAIPDPPSKQQFTDDYLADVFWTPYDYVSGSNEDVWDKLNDVCPQSPF